MGERPDESTRVPLTHVACPECETVQVVVAPGEATGRFHARCVRCDRVWPVPAQTLPPGASLRCREHPGRRARWFCSECGRGYCAECVAPQRIQWVELHASPCCKVRCIPVAVVFEVEPLWRRPADLFRYPFHRKTWPVFVAILVGLHIPVISWLVVLLLAGYLSHVLSTSARGQTHLPEFPDFVSAWESVFFPTARLLLCGWWAFAPLWLYARWQGYSTSDPVVWPLWIFGLLITPMLVMLCALAPTVFAAINPVNVARMIKAMGKDYALLIGYLAVLWAAYLLVRPFLDVGCLGSVVHAAADLYVLIVTFHILGRTAYITSDRVDWGV
jgi:hypothetical protein